MADKGYEGLSNQEYWKKRGIERISKKWDDLAYTERQLAKQYRLAAEDIRLSVSGLYSEYAKKEGLTYAEASRALNKIEISNYSERMRKLKESAKLSGDPRYISEIDRLVEAKKLDRLQGLVNRIDARLLEMGMEQQTTIEGWLGATYEDNYYESLFEVQQRVGFGFAFNLIDDKSVTMAIKYPWSGSMFSDNIWDNRTKLVKELRRTITQGLIKGESFDKMALRLDGEMDKGYRSALRLVRTETSHVIGQSTYDGYKASRTVKRYEYVAVLDKKTSSVCQDLDGKKIDLEDREVGVNANPMHPNCRSTTIAYYDGDDEDGLRIARDDTGKTYYVPRKMKYKEWREMYVENGSESP